MSASAALQSALIATLRADAGLSALLGESIWDNAPPEAVEPYLTLGPSQEIDDSAECILGAECFQQIDIWTKEDGSQFGAKQICGAVKKALHDVELPLADPFMLVLIEVQSIRTMGDPDEKIAHGIVNVRALIDEDI